MRPTPHIDNCTANGTNYARGVLPLDITAVLIDSHEIGNAIGMEGVEIMVREGLKTPLWLFQHAPAQAPCGNPQNQTSNFRTGLEETQSPYHVENVFGLGARGALPALASGGDAFMAMLSTYIPLPLIICAILAVFAASLSTLDYMV